MIEIETGPWVLQAGSFLLSWHGLFSAIGVLAAIFLISRWGKIYGIDPDDIYSIATWTILPGIIGARFVYVVDNWTYFGNNLFEIFAIWSGGIGLLGGIIGGFIGGTTYAILTKKPALLIADITAPALFFGQAIGRLGDIANGEHCAKATDLFFGYVWNHAESAALYCSNGIGTSVQPVIAYEILWNMLGIFVVWKLANRIRPVGMVILTYFAFYGFGRFFIQFLREDGEIAFGLQQTHFVSLTMFSVSVIILLWKARIGDSNEILDERINSLPAKTRAERRREETN